jgi:sortase A
VTATLAPPVEEATPAPAPRAPSRSAAPPAVGPATVLRQGLALFVILVVALAAFLFVGSGWEHDRDQHRLLQDFDVQLGLGRAPIGGSIPPGMAVAVLDVEALGLREVVVEGTASGVTRSGPGHLRATPLPGQRGNSVIAARRTTFGAPFGSLDDLRPGDRIVVTTGQGRSRYRVTGRERVAADDASVFASRGAPKLSLVTSDPPVVASDRLVVTAALVGKPKATTPHPTRVEAGESTLDGERGVTIALVLALQALLGASLAVVWMWRRWRRWPAYVIGTPVLLALLWVSFDELVRWLPATL